MRDLRELPKGHLHVHLEGAMRPSSLAEMAAGYGIPVPEIRGYGSFPAFAALYSAAAAVLQTEDDLRRLTREVVEDAAADGAMWVEPQLWPGHHASTLGPSREVFQIVLDEGRSSAQRLGIGFGLMATVDRTRDPALAEELAEVAVTLREDGLVSFGLANDEALWPPEPFARAFAIAREGGLINAPHAGELSGPESVRGALDHLGARRIAHGVRVVEDPGLVSRLVDEQVCIDVCPTSNVMLSVVPNIEAHMLPRLAEAGVRFSINGDDPLLFGPGLLDEYVVAREALGLTDTQLAFGARCSIESSGAPAELVAQASRRIDDWLADPA